MLQAKDVCREGGMPPASPGQDPGFFSATTPLRHIITVGQFIFACFCLCAELMPATVFVSATSLLVMAGRARRCSCQGHHAAAAAAAAVCFYAHAYHAMSLFDWADIDIGVH